MVKFVPKRDGSITVIGKNGIQGNLPGVNALGAGNEELLDPTTSTLSTEIAETESSQSSPSLEEMKRIVDERQEAAKVSLTLDDTQDKSFTPWNRLSPDYQSATKLLASTYELEDSSTYNYASRAYSYFKEDYPEDELDLMNPDDAAEIISSCVSYRVGYSESQELVDGIRAGRIRLSRREVMGLVGMKDLILEQHTDQVLAVTGMEEWVPMQEQRNCTLCGQFISARKDHVNCTPGLSDELRDRIKDIGDRRVGAYEVDGNSDNSIWVSDLKYYRMRADYPDKVTHYLNKDLSELGEETLRDLFYTAEDTYIPRTWEKEAVLKWENPYWRWVSRRTILMSFSDKSLFGRKTELKLPDSLRKAFVEYPISHATEGYRWPDNERDTKAHRRLYDEDNLYSRAGSNDTATLTLVAETIEPPFTENEMDHMIDAGGPFAALGLLRSPRTRDAALSILANNPSHAGAVLAVTGELPESLVEEMASSGDPRVRRQAAIAANLPEHSLKRLAEDPSEDVRLAVVNTNNGLAFQLNEHKANDIDSSSASPHGRGLAVSYLTDRMDGKGPKSERMNRSTLAGHPRLLPDFFNDPSEKVAEAALHTLPVDRGTLYAMGQVRSRRRLEFFRSIVLPKSSGYARSEYEPLLRVIDTRLAGTSE